MTNTAPPDTAPPPPAKAGADKRAAILAAALRLITRHGLHDTPMSAIAREAGVAAGTLYLYFPSKEAMINELYLQVSGERSDVMMGHLEQEDPHAHPRAALWQGWQNLARWHLDHRDESNFIDQCQASGILTPETREIEQQLSSPGRRRYEEAVAQGIFWPMTHYTFWSIFAGSVYALAQMRDYGEIEITDELLGTTFDAVCRALLRPDSAASA